jgi:O-antigen/teichoic acid export membrane protein
LFILTFVLVPRYGTLGATFSFIATSAIGLIALAVLVYRRFGALMSKSVLIKGAIATAVLLPAVSMVSAAGILADRQSTR